jgi:hypothetical protein
LGREFAVAFAVDYIKQARVLVVALTQDKNLGQLSSNRPLKQLANKMQFVSQLRKGWGVWKEARVQSCSTRQIADQRPSTHRRNKRHDGAI